MLYQLSYLGAAGPKGLRAPVYSQPRQRCPPAPALLSIWASDGKSTPIRAPAEMRRDGRSNQFSTLIFASRITGPHLSISDLRNEANSAGVEPFGTAPSSSNRDLTGA
jgi:hypothetical protein